MDETLDVTNFMGSIDEAIRRLIEVQDQQLMIYDCLAPRGVVQIVNCKSFQSITAAKRRLRVLTRSSLKPNSSITTS